jgi:hypothetical protein
VCSSPWFRSRLRREGSTSLSEGYSADVVNLAGLPFQGLLLGARNLGQFYDEL